MTAESEGLHLLKLRSVEIKRRLLLHSLVVASAIVGIALAGCGTAMDSQETGGGGSGGTGGGVSIGPLKPTSISVMGNLWLPVGPSSIAHGQSWPDAYHHSPTTVTGRINAVAVNPSNVLGDVWIGSATGGVWNGSTNPLKWTPMTDQLASLATGVIKLDPSTCTATRCTAVWVGTGENSIRRDTQYGNGVYKGSWNSSTSKYDWSSPLGASLFAKGAITALVLDPSTPNGSTKRLFIALSGGMTSNETQSSVVTTPAGSYGIWRSNDAGVTWTNVLPTTGQATDLEMDPLNSQILFAGSRNGGLKKTIDGGTTWTSINTGIPAAVVNSADWPEIAVYRVAGMTQATLYAALGSCPTPFLKTGTGAALHCAPAIYKSTDSGTTWAQVFAASSTSTYGQPLSAYVSYTHALTIHPSNPNILWFGGINLYKSVMGGTSWTTVGNYVLHPDQHQLAVVPYAGLASGILAFAVNDGGLYIGDGDNLWNAAYQDGLQVTQFQSVSTSPLTDTIIGGTQDNGTVVFNGSTVFDHSDDGDSSSTVMDSDTASIWYDVYVGSPPRRCKNSGNCNQTWPYIGTGIGSEDVSWYPPLLEDPNAVAGQHPLYFATQQLYKSIDDGDHWTAISTALGGNVAQPVINAKNPITAVAVAPSDSNRIYVAYYDGQVWTTSNGQVASPTWTAVSPNGLPGRPVTSLAVHPTNALQAFVAFAGFGTDSVYQTSNAGAAWTSFSPNSDAANDFATASVNVIDIEKTTPYRMWAGTDFGVYTRDDPSVGPNLWNKTSPNLPNVAVYDFAIDDAHSTIYAATHGRGIWSMSGSPRMIDYGAFCCGYIDLFDPVPFVPIYANLFEPNKTCTITVNQGAGVPCAAAGAIDADGATLSTDRNGVLVATKASYYTARPMAWGCYGGVCAGGAPSCNATSVTLTCGSRTITSPVKHAVTQANPPSTAFTLTPKFLAGVTGSSFTIKPTIKQANGTTAVLCSSTVSFTNTQTIGTILANVATAINANTGCVGAGVSAYVTGNSSPGGKEDEAPISPQLSLRAATLTGVELFTSVVAGNNAEFNFDAIGVLGRQTLVTPRLTFTGTSIGGSVIVTERSPLGVCKFAVSTLAGDTASTVASKVAQVFMNPAPTQTLQISQGCLNGQNSRDITRSGAVIRFMTGLELSLETTDTGLSYTLDTE
jgi:hypothetical protein